MADPEHVVAHMAGRLVALVEQALVEARGRILAYIALPCGQHGEPFAHELIGRQRHLAMILNADELRDVRYHLAHYIVLTAREHRDMAHAKSMQPLASAGMVHHVDDLDIDVVMRKKLFRLQAAASPGLQEERIACGVIRGHVLTPVMMSFG